MYQVRCDLQICPCWNLVQIIASVQEQETLGSTSDLATKVISCLKFAVGLNCYKITVDNP